MRYRVQLQIGWIGRPVIQHQDRAFLARKKLFKSENLASITERALCKETHL